MKLAPPPDDIDTICDTLNGDVDYHGENDGGSIGPSSAADPYFASSASFASATDSRPWPTLHPDALHGLPGAIVAKIDPHTEADPFAILLQTIVAFGNVIGRSAHFLADGASHYLNLYCVLVGLTSKGRKGTAWNNVKKVYDYVDRDWIDARVLGGLSSGEGLIWAVRDAVVKRVPIKAKGRHTGEYDDVVEHEAVTDKRLLAIEGEYANVLKVAGREGNTLSPIIRTAWDTGNLRSMTKGCPATATGAHFSIIAHITKDELRRTLNQTEAANGFGNRFLWAMVQRSKCLPDGGTLHLEDLTDITAELALALVNAQRVGTITRDSEARDLWHEVYPKLSEGMPGMAGSLTGRAEAQAMRLACIYALMDQSNVVKLPHLKAALAVWDYCLSSVVHIFGASMGDPVADELYVAIKGRGEEGMTRTEMSRHFGGHKEASQLGSALSSLASRGLVRMQAQQTGGRPVERWLALNVAAKEAQ